MLRAPHAVEASATGMLYSSCQYASAFMVHRLPKRRVIPTTVCKLLVKSMFWLGMASAWPWPGSTEADEA